MLSLNCANWIRPDLFVWMVNVEWMTLKISITSDSSTFGSMNDSRRLCAYWLVWMNIWSRFGKTPSKSRKNARSDKCALIQFPYIKYKLKSALNNSKSTFSNLFVLVNECPEIEKKSLWKKNKIKHLESISYGVIQMWFVTIALRFWFAVLD